MTIEQQIYAYKALKENNQAIFIGTHEEADRVIEGLEKQIPKKTLKIQGDKLKFGTCPCCGRRISTVEGGNYCQNCGNAIDWSVEDGSS